MRKSTLAVIISSVLLGAAAVQAEPILDPSQSQQAQAVSETDSSEGDTEKVTTSPSQDADGAKDSSNAEVGSKASNVDEKSSSGSYYPYSAGTVGDDPAKPTSTSVSTDGNDKPSGPTDQWGDADADGNGYVSEAELTKIAPDLSASFTAMDSDGDKQLSRGEFRTWHESHKAKMDSGDGEKSTMDDTRTSSSTLPDSKGE